MSLPVWQRNIVTDAGDIIPSPVMTILIEQTGLPATLFSDRNGIVPLGAGGVFNGGTDGFAQFYAAPNEYRVTAEDAGSGFSQTWRYEILTGTAATADVQTSSTDTTAGALMAVGAGGLLSKTSPTAEADLNSNTTSGDFAFIRDSTANTPAGMGASGVLTVKVRSEDSGVYRLSQTIRGADGGIFERQNSGGTWSDWKRTDPQAFGWGLSTGLNSSADLDTYIVSGQYSVQSASPNNPTGNAILTVGVRNSTNVTQFLEATISTSGIYRRTLSAGVWSAWQPVYTGANYQPEVIGGIGVAQLMQNASGGNQFAGNDYAGSLLRFTKFVAGVPTADGTPVTSVWKYLGNSTLANLDFSMYVRKS